MNKRTDRRDRINATRGLPLLTISSRRLLTRTDWQLYCGAVYPDRGLWHRRPNGKIRYIGRAGTNAAIKV